MGWLIPPTPIHPLSPGEHSKASSRLSRTSPRRQRRGELRRACSRPRSRNPEFTEIEHAAEAEPVAVRWVVRPPCKRRLDEARPPAERGEELATTEEPETSVAER